MMHSQNSFALTKCVILPIKRLQSIHLSFFLQILKLRGFYSLDCKTQRFHSVDSTTEKIIFWIKRLMTSFVGHTTDSLHHRVMNYSNTVYSQKNRFFYLFYFSLFFVQSFRNRSLQNSKIINLRNAKFYTDSNQCPSEWSFKCYH